MKSIQSLIDAAFIFFHGWDRYGHEVIFNSPNSVLTAPLYVTLSKQQRVDLAWCDYADWLRGFCFEGPAQDAAWRLLSERYDVDFEYSPRALHWDAIPALTTGEKL